MNGPWHIEVLARNGDVLHRQRVDRLPIRIGRAYDCDFILDDAHTGAHHALIEATPEGGLQLRDLGSQNGTVHRGRRVHQLALDGDTVVRMGHTNLRVRAADYPVAAELVDRTNHGWEGALPGVSGLLLVALFMLATVWQNDTQSFQPLRYLQWLAGGVLAGLLWAGVWAFANRLFGRGARFGRHLFILGAALAATLVYKYASSVLAFAFSWDWITRFGSLAAILIASATLYFHFTTIKPHHPRRFAGACGILFGLVAGLDLMSNQQRLGTPADDLYMAVLLPPALRVSQERTVDSFLAAARSQQGALDAERGKAVKDDDLDEE
ncbi:FHA domain-containing protein [Massilia sp. TS11]|uniref:FHA domain-containing protein n=1 Tax=Massilia sp. TS11 TaxID=2908003 RepID=UPI001EDB9D23|nr:FHA domain-containing protein [Massilia sp. TS11]MCG2583260.1 FHA domain-containing protein [Massilia sp. TS11]